ncbi:MAG TPA: zinc ribbon domain-containing protein [Candidatus Thermoplasmatota archaeon]|nr:zinc ribbon domain-containing protein [Candidatus Thermoplasmatota archaeon]
MARLKCPKCGTVVEQFSEKAPVCPNCGFGSEGSRLPAEAGVGSYNARAASLGAAAQRPAGKPRPFHTAFLLSLPTLPVAGIFYHHMAFRELDLQAGRRPAVSWSVLAGLAWGLAAAGLAALVLQWVLAPGGLVLVWAIVFAALLGLAQLFLVIHLAGAIERLKDDRAQYGLEGGLKPALVYLWATVGVVLLIGPFIAMDHLRRNVNRLQSAIYRHSGTPLPGWADRAYPPEQPAAPGDAALGDGAGAGIGEAGAIGEEEPVAIDLDPRDLA